jgi:hypothetical protein
MTLRAHDRAQQRRPRALSIALALLLGLAACGPVASPVTSPTGTFPGTTSSPPPPSSSLAAEATPSQPTLAGYEGWTTINPGSVDIGLDGTTLVMTLTKRALWFQNQQGVLFSTNVTGDFRITARVSTAKASDPLHAPGGDGTVQLAGLMARAAGPRENYVFIVVGSDADGLSVETKSTTNDASVFEGPSWPSGTADLQLCRQGSTFTLLKSPDAAGGWVLAKRYERADLPATLQVGANIYSDSTPDLVARFEGLTIAPLAPGEIC